MNKEVNESVVLTPELFREIVTDLSDEMIELKSEQSSRLSQIRSEKEYLKQLKAQYKETRKNIRVTRRGLRQEKRSLRQTNRTITIKKDLTSEINDKFASSNSNEDTYIDVARYGK